MQSEAQKLRDGQDVHRDLVTKFEAVTKELEATKDTLANTLAQLAEKTSSANSAETSVSEALQALKVRCSPFCIFKVLHSTLLDLSWAP